MEKNEEAELKLLKLKLSLTEDILAKYEKIHSAINGVASNLQTLIMNPKVDGDGMKIEKEKFDSIWSAVSSLRQNGWQDLYNPGQYEDELKEIGIKKEVLKKL